MSHLSSTAMVLAAGMGMRMRPLTLTTPKPLLKVGGRTMLDHALDKLREAGIRRVVVNCHYLADQIIAHCEQRQRQAPHDMELILSPEHDLLETGGGIKKALDYFEGKPFLALNADLPWQDNPAQPSLPRMLQSFDAERMDALLLVMPTQWAQGFTPRGDYCLDVQAGAGAVPQRLHRHDLSPPFPYVMIGAQLVKPAYYAAESAVKFSNTVVWDKAEAAGRLYGIEHCGTCYHVGTPDDLRRANDLLDSGQGWRVRGQ